jgi:transaldolase
MRRDDAVGLLVLDRDGVLNRMVPRSVEEPLDSPLQPEEVEIVPGVPAALRRLQDAGFTFAIATNQPAAAKGKTTRAALDAVHERIVRDVQSAGARIASSHICFHRAEDGCDCRKPRTALLQAALNTGPRNNPVTTWMVGDRATDIIAGATMGFQTALLGPARPTDEDLLSTRGLRPSFRGRDLQDFADFLLGEDHPMPQSIKLFSDGADLGSLLEMAKNPRIAGFTTNPTLMRKAGVKDYAAFAQDVLAQIKDRPISFEVFADEFDEMARQAKQIAAWGSNVYVKVPISNTRGESSLPLVKELSVGGRVQLNVTALCTLEQVHGTAQALRGGAPAVISVFAGRIADTGRDPIPLMKAARAICDASGATAELLWASPRELLNIIQAEEAGAHIITVPPDMLKKMGLFGKSLADYSLDTVRMFHTDASSAGYKL